MDESEFEFSLEEMFKAQMAMEENPKTVEIETEENPMTNKKLITLVIKPHGFNIPPMKVVASHLQKAYQFAKGVTIMPNRYVKNTLTCLFIDFEDLLSIERAGAW